MYHSRPRRSKSDRPITFRTSVTKAAHEAPSQQPTPDTPDAAPLTPAETPAPTGPQDTALATLSPFDVQLYLLLLWWMHQQQQAQDKTPPPDAPIDTIVVEGVIPPQGLDDERDEEASMPPGRAHPRTRRRMFALVGGGLACLLALTALLSSVIFTPSASVTIIPAQTTLSTSESLTLLTAGTSTHLSGPTIAGRILSLLTLAQARTIPTTGIGHQAAQAAHGQVTFYNAALSPQTIAAGTLLTGSDGVQIVTEQDAVIPPAQLPAVGQTTVAAQAVQVGPAGNIAAGDLNGPCCRQYVLVRNRVPFTGGQDARSYPMVSQHALDSTVATLTTALDQSVQAAYATQLTPTEALVTPVGCTPHVTSSTPVGLEAHTLTVTVSDSCMGVAYDQQAVQTALVQHMTAQAHVELGAGYTLLGDLLVTVRQAPQSPQGTLTLTAQGTGVWAYQFTEAELQHLSSLIAGKSRQQATALLLHQPGVTEVAMSTGTLPTNPQRIRVLVLYRPV